MPSEPGPIARQLLAQLIEVVPEFTALEPYRDRNLNNWRENGAYELQSSNKNAFNLKVNQREYAAVLFAEAQHLLNHASEHRAHLINQVSTQREPSPSWTLVSLYYFSLFVALAWTRAFNAAIIYLDKDAISKYCAGANIRPGAGSYKLTAAVDAITSVTSVAFTKCQTNRFHESVWIAIHNDMGQINKAITLQCSMRKPTEEEEQALRGLSLFEGHSFENAFTWPSALRNAINYRPGFSYRSVVGNNFLRTVSRLRKAALGSAEELTTYGERAKAAVRGCRTVLEATNECVDLLIAQTLFLERHVNEALEQLCKKNGLQCSAYKQRRAFIRKNSSTSCILKPVE